MVHAGYVKGYLIRDKDSSVHTPAQVWISDHKIIK